MPQNNSEQPPQMLARAISARTALGSGPLILYPGVEPLYARLAERLAGAIQQAGGQRPDLAPDNHILPRRSSVLPVELRSRPLVVLGNLNNNRAIFPLYARYYCADDAIYPGENGFDLRTIVNPYGTGANLILAGGSDAAGVERSIERLIGCVHTSAAGGRVEIPFLLEVQLDPGLARGLAGWPETPLDVAIPQVDSGHSKALGATEGLLRAIGAYGSLYAWTGDIRYGEFAAACLKTLNQTSSTSYGDWHYLAERFLRALPWLNASGLLEASDVHRSEQLILGTLLGTQEMWWRKRSGDAPLGHRHQGKGTYEFLLASRYLIEQGAPNPAARVLLERWIAECRGFMDGLVKAEVDDQDDESTLNNLATLTFYAFGEERFDYFESGAARRVAERAIALHDNLGAGAGQGGYAEGQAGAAYYQQEATSTAAAAVFYYQDARLKWILNHLPNLRIPLRLGFLGFTPLMMHHFATGSELPEQAPVDYAGLSAVPVPAYQYQINQSPPEHYEPAGHSINAPETWMPGEGIGIAAIPPDRIFNKLVFRGGFDPSSAYLLLQGYQGGFRWQGHLQAANCIVRFSQDGHIFLNQNTSKHAIYHKNGVFVNNGRSHDLMEPFAELLAQADFSRVAASTTRLNHFHGTDWTRRIFWSKSGSGFFVVIDTLDILEASDYILSCSWYTPGWARLEERTWTAEQGDSRFTLRSGITLKSYSAVEEDHGGFMPTVLRQVVSGALNRGDTREFQNIFYVRGSDSEPVLDLRRLERGQAVVTERGQPLAWCAANTDSAKASGLGLQSRALSSWVSATEVLLSQAVFLDLGLEDWRLESSQPVDLFLDLVECRLTIKLEALGGDTAFVRLHSSQNTTEFILAPGNPLGLAVPRSLCSALAGRLKTGLLAMFLPPAGLSEENGRPDSGGDLTLAVRWTYEDWTTYPERLRDLTVQASPPPLDGFSDQLVDAVLPEMRETWQQWPKAERYEIVLRLPQNTAVDHLRIIGDSDRDPTLHQFQPLPDGIVVEASSDNFVHDRRLCPLSAQSDRLYFRRYRDVTDRMETRRAAVGQAARSLRVRVPAPPANRPLVLHEVEVYGQRQVRVPLTHLLAVDLGRGDEQIVLAANRAGELLAVSGEGELLWKTALPGAPSHISCHDLEGMGMPSICLGLADGELRVLDIYGKPLRSAPLTERFREHKDSHFGWLHTINALAVWRRDSNGRAALAVGGYASVAFLDPDLNLIGHSWADGAWQTDILPVHPVEGTPGSIWVRNGWNHGICVYEAIDSFDPSHRHVTFGGVKQPLFRALRKVIPFVSGRSLAFQALGADRILVAAEMGMGMLSIERMEWIWKHEGGAPLTACQVGENAHSGEVEIVTGSADGFLTAWAAANGAPLRWAPVGAPLTGMAYFPVQGRTVVGTLAGLRILDPEWRCTASTQSEVRRVIALNNGAAVTEEDGALRAYRV